VTPILVNFDRPNQLTGHPLEQYNAVLLDQDGARKLCESIALSAERSVADVGKRFDQLWELLNAAVEHAKESVEDQPKPPEVSEDQRIDVLTASIKSLERKIELISRSQLFELVRGTTNRNRLLAPRAEIWDQLKDHSINSHFTSGRRHRAPLDALRTF